MITTTDKNREKFKALLFEMFQFDCADLDFGIYAILNQRRKEIEHFIDHLLDEIVNRGMALLTDDEAANAEAVLADARKALIKEAGDEVLDAQGAISEDAKKAIFPGVKNAVKAFEKAKEAFESVRIQDNTKAIVFNDLLTFFDRYYEDGDFVTKRRFGKDKFAVPYNGQEVHFHWANANQYYVKSGEHFNSYSFTLDPKLGAQSAKVVLFKLESAQIDRDNTKSDEKRFFVLSTNAPFRWDEQGRTLSLNFEYRALTVDEQIRLGSRNQQEDLNAETVAALAEKLPGLSLKAQLLDPDTAGVPTLIRHLNRFTARNTRDFFIHRDLSGFLRGELDYYIKNEVIRLDDIDPDKPVLARAMLKRAKTVEVIAREIIDFLAQIEDFQKYLFEKRKFVTQSDYCLTLDKIPAEVYSELLPDILANNAQLAVWRTLYALDTETAPDLFNPDGKLVMDENFLRLHPHLMLDTAHFNEAFKAKLLTAFDNLEAACDGLLVHGENFQALNLLSPKYQNTIQCIHIDPPYNTQTSGFLYKNEYQHSSWLTMMENRIGIGLDMLSPQGAYLCHIDENEYERLHLLLENFSIPNAGTVIWDKRNPMNAGRGIATQHEYVIWRSKSDLPIYLRSNNIASMLAKATEIVTKYGSVSEDAQKEYATWVNRNPKLSGGEKAYRYLDAQGHIYQSVSLRAPEPRTDEKFHKPLLHPVTGNPCPVPPNGFSRTPETLQGMITRGEIIFGRDETIQPRQKRLLTTNSRRQISSVIQDARTGKTDVSALGVEFPYCHPVVFYEELIGAASDLPDAIILDFFAGSGTTGHAVMNLNREDGGDRKYILVEMGDYFDTVLRPRLMKVAYAADWKNGKPVAGSEGQSQMFRYIRLESYEDALNNVRFMPRNEETAGQISLLDAMKDYTGRHMLFYESRDNSPTLIESGGFSRPFEYTLNFKRADDDADGEARPVDLVTTFNFLLGLKVKTHREYQNKWGRVVCITGTDRAEKDVVVLWRNVPEPEELAEEARWLKDNVLNGLDFDTIYTNGLGQESISFELKTGVRPLESEFKRRLLPQRSLNEPGDYTGEAV